MSTARCTACAASSTTISSISAQETVANLEAVAATPAAALGSTRDKPDRKYCQEIFKVLKAHAIDTFFYIGGNDSSDTVRIVAEEAKKADHGLRAIHIPKTIDNDLVGFDHTPGYPVGGALRRAGLRRRQSRQRRAAGRLLRGRDGPARRLPHRRLGARRANIPTTARISSICPSARSSSTSSSPTSKATYERHGRCIIAVSEGIHDENGEAIITKLMGNAEKDAHGNVQLSGTGALADLLCEEVKAKLGIKRVRGDTFGYLQRSFVGCVCDVDQREAREVGEKAVQYAMWRRGRRLGRDPPRRRLRGRLSADPARDRRRQDAGDGGRPHQRGRQRRDARRSATTCARCSARTCPRSRGSAQPRWRRPGSPPEGRKESKADGSFSKASAEGKPRADGRKTKGGGRKTKLSLLKKTAIFNHLPDVLLSFFPAPALIGGDEARCVSSREPAPPPGTWLPIMGP